MVNDFQTWMQRMGFNGKQVGEAGRRLGYDHHGIAGKLNRGERELTETERLAMAALRAGLPAWTPDRDQEIADVAELQAIMQRAAARKASAHDDASGQVPSAA